MATLTEKDVKVADTDKITKRGKGFFGVTCEAKKGKASYTAYSDLDVLKAAKGAARILISWNRQERTDAVNTINRPSEVPPEIKKLRELSKSIKDPVVKAKLDADIEKLYNTYAPQ